jgi:hypothetical protein
LGFGLENLEQRIKKGIRLKAQGIGLKAQGRGRGI